MPIAYRAGIAATAAVLAVVAAGCGSDQSASEAIDEAVVTTLIAAPIDATGEPSEYRSPTRTSVLEGIPSEAAEAAALTAGWERVLILNIDEPKPDRPSDYYWQLMRLYERDGIVQEAWTGG